MFKHGVDQDALIAKFSETTAQQGEALRKTVHEVTLKALQARELTLTNIKQVVGTVAKAASSGAATSKIPGVDVEDLLGKAMAGMDDALAQAVAANKAVLEQMVAGGASLREAPYKKALIDLGKMEDTLLATVRKLADDTNAQFQTQWGQVLKTTEGSGTGTGALAASTVQQLMNSVEQNVANLKAGRELGIKASQAMIDGYTMLVSGVLIGMTGAFQQAGTAAPAAKKKS